MKAVKIKLLLISILLIFSLNSKASCLAGGTFKKNYKHNFQEENVLFIKGIALEIVEYGRYIKVIDDLKGNFTGDSTILVWGAGDYSEGGGCFSNEKLDHLTQYQENDTLIMLVKPVNFENCLEVFGGYTTFDCLYSVLKLSNGYVTGRISITSPWEETMSWDELIAYLSNDVFINAFNVHIAVWSYAYSCHSGPTIIYKTTLYGDTVIDGMNWKIVDGVFMDKGKGLVRTDSGRKVIFRGYPGNDDNHPYLEFPDEELIIYDFSLNVGDSILINYSSSYPSTKSEIKEIDSIVLNDGEKYVYLKDKDQIGVIEGVGFADFHPFYMLLHLPTCASGPFFVCCHVNGELLYRNPLYADCDGTYVINETVSDISHKAKVFFINGQLRVLFDDETLFDVELYNLQGLLLAQIKNSRNEMIANFDNLPKGVYVVRVHSENYVYSEKIVR